MISSAHLRAVHKTACLMWWAILKHQPNSQEAKEINGFYLYFRILSGTDSSLFTMLKWWSLGCFFFFSERGCPSCPHAFRLSSWITHLLIQHSSYSNFLMYGWGLIWVINALLSGDTDGSHCSNGVMRQYICGYENIFDLCGLWSENGSCVIYFGHRSLENYKL